MGERWEELEARWEEIRAGGDDAAVEELRAVVAAHVEAYARLDRLVAERLEAHPAPRMADGTRLGIAAQVQAEAREGLARFRALLARIDESRAF